MIRNQGALFNSPLHFIGFSRGTVVNSEIIQRLGTFFPEAGGTNASNRDLQMTTLDPHDFNQPSLEVAAVQIPFGPRIALDYSNFFEPKVQVWDGVTFADNYYQTVPDLQRETNTFTPAGRDIPRLPATDTYGTPWPREGWRSENPDPDAPLLGEPDVSLRLGTNRNETDYNLSRAGFTKETDPLRLGLIELFQGQGGTHGRVLTWYDGTSDLAVAESPDALFRRRGDAYHEHLFDKEFYDLGQEPPFNPWYAPDHKASALVPPTDFDPAEGIGTGWFYSVLGGGKDLRPETDVERVPLDFDNTSNQRMRGDYAVPTLFNGNFDAVTNPHDFVRNQVSREIPGWSYHNSASSTLVRPTDSLVDLQNVGSLEEHLTKVGNDPNSDDYQTNYALKLEDGQSITHNRFVVPDWGNLRFDLHVPQARPNSTGLLLVSIKGDESGDDWEYLEPIELRVADDPNSGNRPNAVGYYDFADGSYTDPYSYRIGYGTDGFETFDLNVPEELRGKQATLRFELEASSSPVYLDNVFFKSAHVMLGNPTNARYSDNPAVYNRADQQENYLLEKPQYVVSYNNDSKGPNWVSWQLNQSWLGTLQQRDLKANGPGSSNYPPAGFPPPFSDSPDASYPPSYFVDYPWVIDNSLPDTWIKTQGPDYRFNDRGLDRGHMLPAADRSRTFKDMYATFHTTNVLPQHQGNNRQGSAWANLENDMQDLVTENNRELYMTAGGFDYSPRVPKGHPELREIHNKISTNTEGRVVLDSNGTLTPNPKTIRVPNYTWKIVVALEPGQGLSDVTVDTEVIAVITPNRRSLVNPDLDYKLPSSESYPNGFLPNGVTNWNDWEQWRVSVDYLEELTGYDFLSNIPEGIQAAIESEDHNPYL